MYRVQSSEVFYVQSVEFKSVLHTECNVQECTTFRVQSSGVCYAQRSALYIECKVQECAMYSVAFRNELRTKFKRLLHTECRVEKCTSYRVQHLQSSPLPPYPPP